MDSCSALFGLVSTAQVTKVMYNKAQVALKRLKQYFTDSGSLNYIIMQLHLALLSPLYYKKVGARFFEL